MNPVFYLLIFSGKPAALYETTNPDWLPSLKLGYAPPTTSATPRYARSKTRHDRKRVPTVTEAHSDPTENSSLLESEEVTVAAAVTQLTPDLEPDDDSILQQMRAEMQRLLTDNIKLREGNCVFPVTAWGGRASDKFITDHCTLLDKLLPGDLVLADRGFDIETSVGLMCAEVKMPAFTKGRCQLCPER